MTHYKKTCVDNDIDEINKLINYDNCTNFMVWSVFYSNLDTIKFICNYIKSIIDKQLKNVLQEKEMNSALFYSRNNLDDISQFNIVKYMIEFYVSIGCFIYISELTINTLVDNGYYLTIKYLLEYPENKNENFNIFCYNNSIFKRSCRGNNLDLVKYLFEKYQPINNDFTILCNSISNINIFKFIINYPHTINQAVNIYCDYLLMMLIIYNTLDIINYLIQEFNLTYCDFLNSACKNIISEDTDLEQYHIFKLIINDIDNLQKYLDIATFHNKKIIIQKIKEKQFQVKIAKKKIIYFWYNYVIPKIWNPQGKLTNKLINELVEISNKN